MGIQIMTLNVEKISKIKENKAHNRKYFASLILRISFQQNIPK